MKKLIPAISLLVVVTDASAQLVYEPFNYAYVASPPSILDGQTNVGNGLTWSKMSASPGTDDDILIANSNIGPASLAPATGKSVAYGGSGASERLGLGQEFTSGTLYYSLAFEVTSALTTTPAYIAGFSNGSGPSGAQPQSVGTRLFLKQGSSASTFRIGVSKNSNNSGPGGDVAWDDTQDFALNTPIFVVGSYQIVPTTIGDDVAKLYINPQQTDFGAATPVSSPALTAPPAGTDLPGSAGGSGVAGFVLRQQIAAVPNVQVDELRVDRTWAQVTPPVGVSWNVNANGAWSVDGNWFNGPHPNDAAAFVNFTSIAQQATSINVDGSYSLRTINFTGNGPYTLNGSGTLNLSASSAVNVMAGNHTISAAVNMDGDLLASVRSGSTLALSGTITANGNSFTKAGAGTVQLANARFNQLNIVTGKVQIIPSGTVASVSKVSALSVSSSTVAGVTTYNATLDLTNNAMVIDYPVGQSPIGTWNGSAYTGILGAIQSGRNGGAWNGAGIITSQTGAIAPSKLTTVGVTEASSALGLTGSATATWRGQTVDASSLLIRYTYTGDANLDAKIDADDYFIIDRNYNTPGSKFGYGNGDFDYNGVINGDDYFLIDSSFASQSGPPPALPMPVSSVPEPATLTTLALAGATLLRRKRRL